jgi:hypothetical protein
MAMDDARQGMVKRVLSDLQISADTHVEGTSVKQRPHLRDWGASETCGNHQAALND